MAVGACRVGLVVAAGAALTLSACGSSSSSSSPSGTTAVTFHGAPVKIGLIDSFKTAEEDNSSSISSAKAAARALNAKGGIDGHEVEIDACNDEFSITGATSCGRQMVTDHVLAVTGGSIFDAGFQPLLASAGIPIVGQYASSITAWSSSNEYLLVSGTLFELYGATAYAATHGLDKIFVSRQDVAVTAAISATVKAAAAKLKYSYLGDEAIPATATDLSSYAQKLISSGANAVVLGYAAATTDTFVKAAESLGSKASYIYTAGDLQNSDIATLGSAGPKFVLASGLPPMSATTIPGIALMRTQLAAEQAAGDSGAALSQQSTSTEMAWLAVQAVDRIAPKTGPLTPATLTAALKTAKGVDLMGMIPPWTPSTPGPAPFTRISNPDVYIDKIVDKQLVLAQPKEVNALTAIGL